MAILVHHHKSERVFMQLESELLENNVLKIVLDGRLDIAGAQAIDSQFSALAATKKARIVVDMAKVDFLASIGIRTLLSCAKTSSAYGGKIVLFNLQPLVKDVLDTTGVTSLIPVVEDEKMALKVVKDI
jgi:anti-anti-sigma factor